MIKYLNHELEEYESNIQDKTNEEYGQFKCKKCNHVIFYYNKQERYWEYTGGLDYEEAEGTWAYLELTCEEQIIKGLLE